MALPQDAIDMLRRRLGCCPRAGWPPLSCSGLEQLGDHPFDLAGDRLLSGGCRVEGSWVGFSRIE